MSKSLAHFVLLSSLKFTFPHSSSLSLFVFLSCPPSLTLFLYLGISPFPLLSSYVSVVSICSLSDRFGSWFRRWEAGSISQVSVYSSWVMTPTVTVWSELLFHLSNVVLDYHTVRVCLDPWRPYMPVSLQAVEMSQHMQREVLQTHSVQPVIANSHSEQKEHCQLCLFHFTQELTFMCTQTQTHICVHVFIQHTPSWN